MKASMMASMMVWTLALGSAMAASAAPAPKAKNAGEIKLTCVTTDYPTTSFVVETVGAEVHARVIHHNGMKFMPIWSAIVVPNDLPMISTRASELAKLGETYTVRFAKSACKKTGEKMFDCFGGLQTDHQGIKLRPDALHTERVTYDNIAGVYQRHWMHLTVSFDGKSHPISMQYQPEDCFED
jgi:hypothetical protein